MDPIIAGIREDLKPNASGRIEREQMREVVKKILDATDMSNRPVDTVALAKKLGFTVFDSSLSHLDGGDVIGLMYDGEEAYKGVREKRFIALEENDSHQRKRGTILHEIGHYTLEAWPEGQNYILSMRHITPDRTDPKEQNASLFMYELLMPHDLLVKALNSKKGMEWGRILTEISNYLDVSFGLLKRHIEIVWGKPVFEQKNYQGGYPCE